MNLGKAGINWMVVAFFGALLLAASLVSNEALPPDLRELITGKDLILHGLAYGILAVLACRALSARGRGGLVNALVVGVLLAVGYGAILEVIQGALTWRTCSILDAGANAVGAGLGGLLWLGVAARGNLKRDEAGDSKF